MTTPQEQLRKRTTHFALAILKLTRTFPNNPEGWTLGKQLIRSGTSVAANYRAAGRSRSRVEFAAKIGVVVEEADGTLFWLELAEAAGLICPDAVHRLLAEGTELLKIFSASYETAKAARKSGSPTR